VWVVHRKWVAAVAAFVGVVAVFTPSAGAVAPPVAAVPPVAAAALPDVPGGAVFVPISPCRVADTRATSSMQPGATRSLQVGGTGGGFVAQGGRSGGCGVPDDAVAAELSVSAVTPSANGYLRVWPTGVSAPNATFVNYSGAQGTTNTGAVPLGAGTKDLVLGNYGARAHVVIDVQGYYAAPDTAPEGSVYVPISPCRAVDTRTGAPMGPNATRSFQLGGPGSLAGQGGRSGGCGVPADATAVEASVTAVGPKGTGYLRAWPTGQSAPNATFVNYSRNQGTTNTGALAIAGAPLGVTVRNVSATTDVVIDVQGYFADPDTVDGSLYVPVTPCRVVDSRAQRAFAAAIMPPDTYRLTQVSGDGPTIAEQGGRAGGCGVPDGATAVELALSAVTPQLTGYLRAWPSGLAAPNATFLNYTNGRATTNAGAVPLAATGVQDMVLANFGGGTETVVDVLGYFSDGTVAPTELSGVASLDAGGTSTCAVLVDTTVTCWGYGPMFAAYDTPSVSPLAVPGLTGVTQVSVGDLHACALLADTTVRCWGNNLGGQLGNGTFSDSISPVVVGGLSGVTQISAGTAHTCATLADGTARCWGNNSNGQLGNGVATGVPYDGSPSPVTVVGLDQVEEVVVGRGEVFGFDFTGFTCARRTDGTVSCWGANTSGQLGNGSLNSSSTPVAVTGLVDVAGLAASSTHVCARLIDASARCWGSDGGGELGDGVAGGVSTVPVAVTGLVGASGIAAGSTSPFFVQSDVQAHSCALVADAVQCWGANGVGALGTGTFTGSAVPVATVDLSGVTRLTAGGGHSCALLADTTVRCWGNNSLGELGVGSIDVSTFEDVRTVPSAVVL
jgi:hypothetical protein